MKILVIGGGRVLSVTSVDDTDAGARIRAYSVIRDIKFEGKTTRKDI